MKVLRRSNIRDMPSQYYVKRKKSYHIHTCIHIYCRFEFGVVVSVNMSQVVSGGDFMVAT